MDKYYSEKIKNGYILTFWHLYGFGKLKALEKRRDNGVDVHIVSNPLQWSHKSGRYRTYKEQQIFYREGMIDRKLPPINIFDEYEKRKEERNNERIGEIV